MGQTSAHAGHTAGQDTAQTVGVEGGAEDSLDLVLQHGGDLITAQVGAGCMGISRQDLKSASQSVTTKVHHCTSAVAVFTQAFPCALTDGVVASEAVASQHSLNAGDPVINAQGSGEVLHHLLVPVVSVEGMVGKALSA